MSSQSIAYGLAKKHGIDTKGMSPKEVWEALAKKGVTSFNQSSNSNSNSLESKFNSDSSSNSTNQDNQLKSQVDYAKKNNIQIPYLSTGEIDKKELSARIGDKQFLEKNDIVKSIQGFDIVKPKGSQKDYRIVLYGENSRPKVQKTFNSQKQAERYLQGLKLEKKEILERFSSPAAFLQWLNKQPNPLYT